MLSKAENAVMKAVYTLCDGTNGCLVFAQDILTLLPKNKHLTDEKLDDVLLALQTDGYFDYVTSERHGRKTYVITLKRSCMSFLRTERQRERDVLFRLCLAFMGALATFIFGAILKKLFG